MATAMAAEECEEVGRTSVSLVGDQEAVEQVTADRSDEALGDRVRLRCSHRCVDDPDVGAGAT